MKTVLHNAKVLIMYIALAVFAKDVLVVVYLGYNFKPIVDVALLQCVRALSEEAATIKLAGELDIQRIELEVERHSAPVCKELPVKARK